MTSAYTAESIKVNKNLDYVRKNYNLEELSVNIKRCGDLLKLANRLGVNRSVMGRAMTEFRILSEFPLLHKSKAPILKNLKVRLERDIFLKLVDVDKIYIRTLKKKIREWHENLRENPLLLLTQEQHDMLIGSGFGDGNFCNRHGKNGLFRESHSKKQSSYLEWKFNMIRSFTYRTPKFRRYMLKGRIMERYEFNTITHPIFTFYHNLFYKKGKKVVTRNSLNQLNERSLAIWICDDGSYCKKLKYIIISTNSFSFREHRLMKTFFKNKWGLSPTIGFRDGKYYYLRFSVEDTKKLTGLIESYIPVKELLYKVNG